MFDTIKLIGPDPKGRLFYFSKPVKMEQRFFKGNLVIVSMFI